MSTKLGKIDDLSIAKEKFNRVDKISNKIAYEPWVEYMEKKVSNFFWLEDTEEGKRTLANIDKIAEDFRQRILENHSKREAILGYNQKDESFLIQLNYTDYGLISISLEKKLKKAHLQTLLYRANGLDAYLLNYGSEVIDQAFIDNYRD